jgi:hypothetical protein
MTQVFVQRQALLPSGETTEQHEQWRKEEADIVQQDRNNEDPRTGGLFKGAFNRPARPGGILQPIRDEEDGVDRCPVCTYELEDGECLNCGLSFNEDGEAQWPDGFAGFSDMDEASEHDMNTEDILSEMEMEMDEEAMAAGFYPDGASDYDEDWGYPEQFMDHPDHMMSNWTDDHAIAVSRWLSGGSHGPPGRRRPAFHSRNHSYTPSLSSHMPTEDTEMGTVEEEDEEDMDDEGSSMNEFIDDGTSDQPPSSSPSQSSSAAPVPTRSRRPRVVESESSSMSQDATEEEDEEDEGPVRPGRRRPQPHPRDQGQARRRRPVVLSDTSAEDDEESQALLAAGGWAPLGNGVDEEMTEDGNESEGGRTTVGWEPITNSNDRLRSGGSLTPTAGRPFPASQAFPRTGNARILDGSRGLRRRSSVLSAASAAHYEDGEADDDDSDAEHIDREGFTHIRNPALQTRRSRVRMRSTTPAQEAARNLNRGLNFNPAAEPDEDDFSDGPQPRARSRREYDPRISLIFAQHLTDMRDRQVHDPFSQLDQLVHFRTGTPMRAGTPLRSGTPFRTITPLSRPRTSNRNRQGQQGPGTPNSPHTTTTMPPFPPPTPGPTRLRTPVERQMGHVLPPASNGSDASVSQASSAGPGSEPNGTRPVGHQASSASATHHTQPSPRAGPSPGRSATYPTSIHSVASPVVPPSPVDIERPISRVGSRPPSAASRRGSAGFVPSYQAFPVYPGLNFAARSVQAHQSRNPYFVRPRQSSQRLREQPSTATLRPSESRGTLRPQPSQTNVRSGGAVQSPHVRSHSSRVNLRNMQSQQRLQSQASTRTLRAADGPPSPQAAANSATSNELPPVRSPATRRVMLTEEERRARATELIRRRQQELNAQDLRNNPFASLARPAGPINGRSSTTAGSSSTDTVANRHGAASPPARPAAPAPDANAHASPNSTMAGGGPSSPTGTAQQPGVSRRRSIRSMAAPPGLFLPLSPGFVRPRSGHMPGVGYEMPINTNLSRGINPMVAGGESQRL